jgi:hypothetical protein
MHWNVIKQNAAVDTDGFCTTNGSLLLPRNQTETEGEAEKLDKGILYTARVISLTTLK